MLVASVLRVLLTCNPQCNFDN